MDEMLFPKMMPSKFAQISEPIITNMEFRRAVMAGREKGSLLNIASTHDQTKEEVDMTRSGKLK
jgi:hypothetical protein